MEIKDLTRYQRRRLNQARKCSICGKEIMDWHHFVMLKHRHRRCMIYEFVHIGCLKNGVKDGEEKYISKNICGNRKNL